MKQSTFDNQLAAYVEAGFDSVAGFAEVCAPLREVFETAQAGDLPPTLVVRASLVGSERLIEAIDRHDGRPQTVIHAEDFEQYASRDGVELPASGAYVLGGISKRSETRNLPPRGALAMIEEAGHSPLTIEDGLAIWRMHEQAIAPNDGLSLVGSTRGDSRVPAIWISKGRPKLGWCFFGAPHTWLATASCSERLTA